MDLMEQSGFQTEIYLNVSKICSLFTHVDDENIDGNDLIRTKLEQNAL